MSVSQALSGASPFHFLYPEEREEHLRARNRGDVARVAQIEKLAYDRFSASRAEQTPQVSTALAPSPGMGLNPLNPPGPFLGSPLMNAAANPEGLAFGLGQELAHGLRNLSEILPYTAKQLTAGGTELFQPLARDVGVAPKRAEPKTITAALSPEARAEATRVVEPVAGERPVPTEAVALGSAGAPSLPPAPTPALPSPQEQRISELLADVNAARAGAPAPEPIAFSERLARFLGAAALGAQRGLATGEGEGDVASVLGGAGGAGLTSIAELKKEERETIEKFRQQQEDSKWRALQLELSGATNLAELDARNRQIQLAGEANMIRAYSARVAALTAEARVGLYSSQALKNGYDTAIRSLTLNNKLLGVDASNDTKTAARVAAITLAPDDAKPAAYLTALILQGQMPDLREQFLQQGLNKVDPSEGGTYRDRLILLRQQGSADDALELEERIISDEVYRYALENPDQAQAAFDRYLQQRMVLIR